MKIAGTDTKITITRANKKFFVALNSLSQGKHSRVRLFPGDKIFLSPITYRNESVLVVGETGAQRAITITSFERPTLSDTIFIL